MSEEASFRDISSASTLASVNLPSRFNSALWSASGLRRAPNTRRPYSHRTDLSSRQQMSLVKLENTYRMEPHDKDRFHPGVVEDILGIQSPEIILYSSLFTISDSQYRETYKSKQLNSYTDKHTDRQTERQTDKTQANRSIYKVAEKSALSFQ